MCLKSYSQKDQKFILLGVLYVSVSQGLASCFSQLFNCKGTEYFLLFVFMDSVYKCMIILTEQVLYETCCINGVLRYLRENTVLDSGFTSILDLQQNLHAPSIERKKEKG